MKSTYLFLMYLLLSFTSSAYAMEEEVFKEADAIYMIAVNGDESSVERAAIHFNKLSVVAPYDLLIQTYKGSIESLMATHVMMPWSKMKHVELGSEWMDDALDDISDIHDVTTLSGTSLSLQMKLIAAHTYFRFPRFLNRYQDSTELVADIFASDDLEHSSNESKNRLYTLAAMIAEDEGDKKKQAEFLAKIQ